MRESRSDLLRRLHAEGRISAEEYRTLAGRAFDMTVAFYYEGGGLLLVGSLA